MHHNWGWCDLLCEGLDFKWHAIVHRGERPQIFDNVRDEDSEDLPNDDEDFENKEIEFLYQEDEVKQENDDDIYQAASCSWS